MWIGTDYGLNRYDGHSVEVFLIVITPPWFKTWWAIALWIIFSAAAMYLILRILRPKKQEVTTTEEQDNIQDIISEGVEGDSHSIVERATAIIEKHLDDPDFNINVFAHEMAMSRTNLFTKLKAAT